MAIVIIGINLRYLWEPPEMCMLPGLGEVHSIKLDVSVKSLTMKIIMAQSNNI